MSDETIEQEIQRKGLNALRVTPEDVENAISSEIGFTIGAAAKALGFPTSPSTELLTIYVLTLKNGFTVMGESACASPENYNAELGLRIARDNAKQKIWPLLGYAIKDFLHSHQGIVATAAVDSVLMNLDGLGE